MAVQEQSGFRATAGAAESTGTTAHKDVKQAAALFELSQMARLLPSAILDALSCLTQKPHQFQGSPSLHGWTTHSHCLALLRSSHECYTDSAALAYRENGYAEAALRSDGLKFAWTWNDMMDVVDERNDPRALVLNALIRGINYALLTKNALT